MFIKISIMKINIIISLLPVNINERVKNERIFFITLSGVQIVANNMDYLRLQLTSNIFVSSIPKLHD